MGSTLNDGASLDLEPLCRIITPIGMLGYGFDEEEIAKGLELSVQSGVPTALILDSGSTDSGPVKLALGTSTCPRSSYVRDWRKLIRAVRKYRVPVLIGSAGGDGSNAHVKEFLDIIKEVLEEPENENVQLKVLAIYSEIEHAVVLEKLEAGKISGCGPCVPPLTANDVKATTTIVGQMGPEPYVRAMAAHPDFDIIVGGRAYDPAPYVAFCAFHAFGRSHQPVVSLDALRLGGFVHMGKIMECGGLCAAPKSHSAEATMYQNGTFDIRPLQPGTICTPTSVAAHTMYEKTRPDILHGPGGYMDLSAARYEALSDGTSVRVRGATFQSFKAQGTSYTLKLEGAKLTGYRSMFMGSFADPILLSQLPSLLQRVKAYVAQQHTGVSEIWKLGFHVYGYDEVAKRAGAGSVLVIAESCAETQATATSVASTARVACVHGPYKGQKATSGNFGFGFGGKSEIECGPCAEFSIYHLMDLDDGDEEGSEVGEKSQALTEGNKKSLLQWDARMIGRGARLQPPKLEWEVEALPTLKQPVPATLPPSSKVSVSEFPDTLGEAARYLRSKNAGPYEITFDVVFENAGVYNRVKASGRLSPEVIAQLFSLDVSDIVFCGFFDQALAFKATIPRMRDGKPTPSGGYMENDVHGSQLYLPLMGLKLDLKDESSVGDRSAKDFPVISR